MNTPSSAWTVVVTGPGRQEIGRYPSGPDVRCASAARRTAT